MDRVRLDMQVPWANGVNNINKPVDMHQSLNTNDLELIGSGENTNDIAVNNPSIFGGANSSPLLDWAKWLPFASKEYNISPDIKDYIIIPIPTIITDIPNRNGIAFPLRELIKFRPSLGMQSYQTWKGKPTFLEHDHGDHTKAKGVILDTHMRSIPGMNVWRLMKLLAFDRSADASLVKDIKDGKYNAYSMGAFLDGYKCSICHAEQTKTKGCSHIPRNAKDTDVIFNPQPDGQLAFRNVINPEGFETSAVATPAFVAALYDKVVDMSELVGQDMQTSDIIKLANMSRNKF